MVALLRKGGTTIDSTRQIKKAAVMQGRGMPICGKHASAQGVKHQAAMWDIRGRGGQTLRRRSSTSAD